VVELAVDASTVMTCPGVVAASARFAVANRTTKDPKKTTAETVIEVAKRRIWTPQNES
jgi:hypothetical protein